eukprot:gnl/MRDRNA2_/MRDRNA2_169665_c0_seq1.p1 gnl/MRDRNA2_/MRDRNA2_169665_c0~~gnl/MRDRNA2_/MRDRNA2_169665_c0_seq1.p1  ORF type:complete len:499 (-),score=55.24 gnl/MRDRNA2_/MRDRNA2_169665_c0_seq1:2-1342(-)
MPAVVGLWADVFRPVPRALHAVCKKHLIQLQVFGVLGYEWSHSRLSRKLAIRSSLLLDNPVVMGIARSKGWAASDVLVKYFLQQGIAVVLRSSRFDRLQQAYLTQDSRRLSQLELESLHELEGFLASSLQVDPRPDVYAGAVGWDTLELSTMYDHTSFYKSREHQLNWETWRHEYHRAGYIHIPSFIPREAIESAQRVAQRFIWEYGGGNWEDAEVYPAALCDEPDFPSYKLDITDFNYLCPLVESVGALAKFLLNSQESGVYYMLIRGKARGCEKAHIAWHQDAYYRFQFATDAETYDEAASDIQNFADNSLTMHVPLTSQTHEKGALMYATGSHNQGLDLNFFPARLVGPAPAYEFSEAHSSVNVMETEPTDLLVHSVLTHHGPRPNNTSHIRWHVELGVARDSYQTTWGHRVPFPPDCSPSSLQSFSHNAIILAQTEYINYVV